MELTLQQLFGANAYQDGQILRINKFDLPLLFPSINNSAESLLAGILLKAFENFQGKLTDPFGEAIKDPEGESIDYDNSSLYQLLLVEPWQGFIKQRNAVFLVTDTLIIHQYSEYADTEFS